MKKPLKFHASTNLRELVISHDRVAITNVYQTDPGFQLFERLMKLPYIPESALVTFQKLWLA